MKRILCLSALALLAVGCVPPRVLVQREIIGGRVAKFTYQKTAVVGSGKDQKNLYDYGVEICEYDNNGSEANCGDTTLMQSVTYFPIPK